MKPTKAKPNGSKANKQMYVHTNLRMYVCINKQMKAIAKESMHRKRLEKCDLRNVQNKNMKRIINNPYVENSRNNISA